MYNHIDMAEATDQELVLRVRRGEVQAYGELVNRHQASVFNVCLRMLGERREAEDMAQEVFLRAYQRLETFDAGRPFGPWIRRVATNSCLNYLARAKPAVVPLLDEMDRPLYQHSVTPEEAHEAKQRSEAVRAAILSLPPHYRAVVELRHFQGLSYAEMAEALGIPISDVKSHLYRARQALARRLLPDV